MEEREAAEAPRKGGRLSSWLKAGIGTVAGLFSGAVMMYVSPLIDKVVKPPRPVANFAVEQEGTTVTFQNRSNGAHDGWWDFGDGSALEPVDPNQPSIAHTYRGPGDYTAKLTVHSLLGEESERVVSLRLDAAQADPPKIEALDVTPVSPGSYAPATFRVKCQVKNAQVCVWNLDDDRPMDVANDMVANQDRLVTFDKPGGYVIKLVAINGKQTDEKSEVVNVLEPPNGTVAAILQVSDQATRVESITVPFVFSQPFPPTMAEPTAPFSKQALARAGYRIKAVRVTDGRGLAAELQDQAELLLEPAAVRGAPVRQLKLELAADRRSVRLSGELVRPANLGKRGVPVPTAQLPVVLIEERRTAAQRPPTPVTATLTAPGSALLLLPPLPAYWVDTHRQMRLELRAGDRVLCQDSQLPRGQPVTINNRPYLLTATPVGSQLRVDLTDARAGTGPSGN